MLEKGTKVRVLGGAFHGRVGVISELDGKGFARVTFGLMSVRLSVDDLTPAQEGGERALLRSSHWKPNATATPKASRAHAAEPSQTGRMRVASAAPLRISESTASSTRSRTEPSGGAKAGPSRTKKARLNRRNPGS